MDIKTLVPIGFSRKITPLVMEDEIFNSVTDAVFKINNQHQLSVFNTDIGGSGNYEPSNYFVISYADRPNTGKQPVADDVIVDSNIGVFFDGDISDCETYSECAVEFPWKSDLSMIDGVIKSWKPNHAAMVEAYQLEEANKAHSVEWPTKEESKRMEPIEQNGNTGLHYEENNFSDVLVKRDGCQIDKPLSFSNDAPEVFINLPEDVIIGRPTNYSPTSNDLELGRLVDFVFSNKLILDGENPVDCAIRELAEKHDVSALAIESGRYIIGESDNFPPELFDNIKPVFTKAMADAGELPPVGSKVHFIPVPYDPLYIFHGQTIDERLILEHVSNSAVIKCGTNQIKPIQTDEDKLRAAIDLAIDEANLGLDSIDRGLITVALLTSNNLNITTKGK